ncbi:MAG: lactoylglutathione lyase [Alphaproteobacteria bacterium]|nr:MAG: lactoylglutathione lyase [Alphaproteobacteria bacterium]
MAIGNRFLHVMIRVLDLNKSIEFYCQHLGLDLLRKKDFSEGRFTLAFLGYGDESDHTVIELTHNWDRTEPYPMGEAFGHLAIGVKDIYTICAELEAKGIEVPRKPGPMKGGTTVIAFVRDPDGYMIEFIER